ncbi:MAG TPA: DUF748 domain-containing protein [bacterium]|nr:DUF748 domain-containing protein [bacterium]HPN31701.1 DUF748 domain-containing protein [bacterium]
MKQIKLIIIILILLAGAAFLLAPVIIKSVLTGQLTEILNRKVEIKDVDFNIFKRNLRINDITIFEPDAKTAFLNVFRINLNFNIDKARKKKIFLYKLDFFYPRIVASEIDGKYNFDDIIESVKKFSAGSDASEYVIRNVRITGAEIIYGNSSFAKKIVISDIDSLMPELTNSSEIIHLDARFRVEDYCGIISSNDIDLKTKKISGYIQTNQVDAEKIQKITKGLSESNLVLSGKLNSELSYKTGINPFYIEASGNLILTGLNIKDRKKLNNIIKTDSANIKGINIRYPENIASIEEIILDKVNLNIELFEKNKTGLDEAAKLLFEKSKEKTKRPEARFSLKKLSVKNSEIFFSDSNLKPPFYLKMSGAECRAENICLDKNLSGKIIFQSSLGDGELRIKINAAKKVSGEVSLENFNGCIISKYLEKYAGCYLLSGKINFRSSGNYSEGKIEFDNNILLDGMIVEESKESGIASPVPIKKSLSGLEDDSGQIKLRLPVKGNLSDPSFNLAGTLAALAVNSMVQAPKPSLSFFGFFQKDKESADEKNISVQKTNFIAFDFLQTELGDYQKILIDKIFSENNISKINKLKFVHYSDLDLEKKLIAVAAAKEKFFRESNKIENRKLTPAENKKLKLIEDYDGEFIRFLVSNKPENFKDKDLSIFELSQNFIAEADIEKKLKENVSARILNLKKYINAKFKKYSQKIIFEEPDFSETDSNSKGLSGFQLSRTMN